MSSTRKFILRSSDGKSYELEGKAALQSGMIRDMIEDDCPDDVIPVSVPGDILAKVVVYCQKHAEYDVIPVPSPNPGNHVLSPLERELLAWDFDFVKVDRLTLSRLCWAANYLNINSLLNVTCQSWANADRIQQKIQNSSPSQERPLKSSTHSSAGVLRSGQPNYVPVAKIKDLGTSRFLVVCHWEGDESTYKVKKIVDALNNSHVPPPDVAEVVVCPPPLSESVVQSSLRGDFQLATEIRGRHDNETYAWELNAEMVVKKGIPWVILGHRDRLLLYRDLDKIVGDKVAYACHHGLKVIACVGETIKEREAGRTMDVIIAQTKAIAGRVSNWENIVLAYNPSWSVTTGSGNVATPAQAQEIHAELRRWLHANVSPEVASTTRIIYGGSVSDADWEDFAIQPDVNGFLVGGSPLKEFIDIIKLAEKKVD